MTTILPPAELGHRLRLARQRAGLRQADVAERIGCSRGAVVYWETGVQRPRLAQAMALAAVYGVPAETLFCEQDDESWVVRE